MEQTSKNLENIKTKLIEHINANYLSTEAEKFISEINSMNENEFVEFLKQQGLLKEGTSTNSKCIFCSIVFGDVPSTKIAENEKATAILDINPASKGHAIVIPKEHVESKENLPPEVGKLATEIKDKLQKAFSPKRIDLISTNAMGHEILNVLPVYENETLESERKKLSSEDAEKIRNEIEESENEKEETEVTQEQTESEEEINETNTWLPKRIP